MKKAMLPLVALVAGCQMLTAPNTTRRLGTIEFYADPARIAAPDTVSAGTAFNVSVVTYGGGCVTQGTTESAVIGAVAQVTVYDEEHHADVCTDELRMFSHTATLQFAQPGTATLQVRGWKEPERKEITVTRQIVVR
jgi:hypothetical protein